MIDADVILSKTGIDVTQVQQGSEEWLRLRLGAITASEASCVISSPRSGNKWTDTKRSYFNKLIAEICTGQSPEVKARPLEWGKENEEVARRLFEFTTGLTVIDVPIIFKEEDMRVACSPDGDCSDGLGLELKCPFTSRDFINFRLNGFDGIKSEYMAQVQFSMWVTGKEAWHFANYDPRMKREGLHNVIVERDDGYISRFEEAVPEFVERMDNALAELGFTFGEQWEL